MHVHTHQGPGVVALGLAGGDARVQTVTQKAGVGLRKERLAHAKHIGVVGVLPDIRLRRVKSHR